MCAILNGLKCTVMNTNKSVVLNNILFGLNYLVSGKVNIDIHIHILYILYYREIKYNKNYLYSNNITMRG